MSASGPSGPLVVICVLCVCLPACLVHSLQPFGHLLGKGLPLGSPVCDVFQLLSF